MLWLNFLIALVWAGLVTDFTVSNLLIGFAIGYAAIAFIRAEPQRHAYQEKTSRAVRFALFYAKEVLIATLSVAWSIVRPIRFLKPAVIAVPLQPGISDTEITAIANLVTYTPGSLSIDVAPGNTHLYVHLFHTEDPAIDTRAITDKYEKPLLEILR